jgi:hypothetical protein
MKIFSNSTNWTFNSATFQNNTINSLASSVNYNIIRAAQGNITITNSSNNVSVNLGANVVVTNGLKQIFTKNLDFGQTTNDFFAKAGLFIRNAASTFTYNLVGGAATRNTTINTGSPIGDVSLSYQPVYNYTSPANKTATSSATLVMYGGYATLTPRYSTNATISVSGYLNNNVINDGCIVDLRTSSSNMGLNGVAVTGTKLGNNIKMISNPALGNQTFSLSGVATGLTAGTKQFFDLSFARLTGGFCHIYNVNWLIREQ